MQKLQNIRKNLFYGCIYPLNQKKSYFHYIKRLKIEDLAENPEIYQH